MAVISVSPRWVPAPDVAGLKSDLFVWTSKQHGHPTAPYFIVFQQPNWKASRRNRYVAATLRGQEPF